MGIHAVQQYCKGLSQFLQFFDDALLALGVFFPRQIGDAAVCGDDQANGGVLRNDFSCAHFCCHIERHFLVEPGGMHHSGLFVFDVSQRTGDNITHTVDHAQPHVRIVSQRQFYRILRDELRLGSHDGSSGGGLGQFICGAFFPRFVRNMRNDQLFHESFDEGGFSGADWADDADINVTAGAAGDVLIDRICHVLIPPAVTVQWG